MSRHNILYHTISYYVTPYLVVYSIYYAIQCDIQYIYIYVLYYMYTKWKHIPIWKKKNTIINFEFVNRISDVSCHGESISKPSYLMVWNEVGSVRSKHCLWFRNRTWLHGTTWHNLFPLCLLWILNFQHKTLLIQLFKVLACFSSTHLWGRHWNSRT